MPGDDLEGNFDGDLGSSSNEFSNSSSNRDGYDETSIDR